VYDTFRRSQLKKKVILAECQTLIYATESRGPAHVEIMKVKQKVRASALPASNNDTLMNVISQVYSEYSVAENVLETSINNIGAVVHPAPMLMNSGLLEKAAKGEDLRYYRDVISRFVCENVMEKIDREKSRVAEAFRVPVHTALEWYEECYGVKARTLYDALQNNEYYLGFSAPKHVLAYHHVLDEIPNSLVPIALFGSAVGVSTPMTKAVVDLACAALGYDFWIAGRSLEKLGLEDMTPEQISTFVNEGPDFWER
jgi:opine dehydrogenase